MIQDNYKIAFKANVFHTYFEKNICSCIQFKPGVGTIKLQKRFDLKIRNRINGFDLFVNTGSSISKFLNYISDATDQTFFDFEIVNNNSSFYLFTDLPSDATGQLEYDTKFNPGKNENLPTTGIPSQLVTGSLFGRLTVHFDDIINYQVGDEAVDFTINFKARSTQWQYYIINKSAIRLENSSIFGTPDVNFDDPQSVTIQTGQSALMFSSGNNLIPLSETPKYKFDLVSNSKAAEGSTKSPARKILFKGLPNPTTSRIGIIKTENKKIITSPIYVYV